MPSEVGAIVFRVAATFPGAVVLTSGLDRADRPEAERESDGRRELTLDRIAAFERTKAPPPAQAPLPGFGEATQRHGRKFRL